MSGHKILDNGACEGQLVDPYELPELATMVGAREIIVPDAPRDTDTTIHQADKFHDVAREHPEFHYIGVVQGESGKDWKRCLDRLQRMGYMDLYALPRNMNEQHKFFRSAFAAGEYANSGRPMFHALGSSSWVEEVKILANLPMIRGMDTAMPIKLALEQLHVNVDTEYDTSSHTKEYFEAEVSDSAKWIVDSNIRTFLRWASGS